MSFTGSATATAQETLITGDVVTASASATATGNTQIEANDNAKKLAKEKADSQAQATINTIAQTIVIQGSYYEWSSRSPPSTALRTWNSVCYGNGIYLAVSNDGSTSNQVMASPDGINWSSVSSVGSKWTSVCYGNGLFVAVSNFSSTTNPTSNKIMTSADGVTWTLRSYGTDTNVLFTSVCYGNGKFVAVASSAGSPLNKIYYSYDAINWSFSSLPDGAGNVGLNAVCFGNGKYICCGDGSSSEGTIFYSPDAIIWNKSTLSGGTSKIWKSVIYANGCYIAVSSNDDVDTNSTPILRSLNGIDWTNAGLTYSDISGNVALPGNNIKECYWESVCYGNGYFVAVASTTTTSPPSPNPGGNPNKKLMSSQDGLVWINVDASVGNSGTWKSICYGDNVYVAVSSNGQIMTSGRQFVNEEATIVPFVRTGTGNIQTYAGFNGTTLISSNIDVSGNITIGPTGSTNGIVFPDGTKQTTAGGAAAPTWTTSGSNIYNENTGNVGIGNTAPAFKLDVSGSARFTGGVTGATGSFSTLAASGLVTATGGVTGAIGSFSSLTTGSVLNLPSTSVTPSGNQLGAITNVSGTPVTTIAASNTAFNVFASGLSLGLGTYMLFANINVTGGTTTLCVFSISATSAVQDTTSAVQFTSTPVACQVSRVVNVTSSSSYNLVATITYTSAPTINSTNTKFYAVRIA